jgi:hypothetical protein
MTLLQQKRQNQENLSFAERETDENVIRSVPKKHDRGTHLVERLQYVLVFCIFIREIFSLNTSRA